MKNKTMLKAIALLLVVVMIVPMLAACTLNKTDLDAKITEAENFVAADYTAESWAVFEAALEQAQKVSADKKAKKADVDSALNALTSAIEGLTNVLTGTYTVPYYSNFANWNPHTWQGEDGTLVMGYLVTPLYDFVVDLDAWQAYQDGDIEAFTISKGHKIIADGATQLPIDVTSSYAGKYGVTAGEAARAWKIYLNPLMAWENGDPIRAKDYEWSLEKLLSPVWMNSRSNTWVKDSAAIVGANGYQNFGSPQGVTDAVDENYNPIVTREGVKLFSFKKPLPFLGGDTAAYYYNYSASYKNLFIINGVDLFEKWNSKADKFGYIHVTNENRDELLGDITAIANKFGDPNPEAFFEWGFAWNGEVVEQRTWDEVGFEIGSDENGEYIVYIYENSRSQFDVIVSESGAGYLVHQKTYEDLTQTVGNGLLMTGYNLPANWNRTLSYGPYKMAYHQIGVETRFEINESWYGHKDDYIHMQPGQYAAKTVKYLVYTNNEAAQPAFQKGDLDIIGVTSATRDLYMPYVEGWRRAPSDSVWGISVNTDLNSLSKITANNTSNATLLAIPEFRKAISLAVDRKDLVTNHTAAGVPAFAVFSVLLSLDMGYDGEAFYRMTPQAKKVIVDYYGLRYVGDGKGAVEPGVQVYPTLDHAVEAATGYDFDDAVAMFNEAYKVATASANGTKYYDPSKAVTMSIYVPTESLTGGLKARFDNITDSIRKAFDASDFNKVGGKILSLSGQGWTPWGDVYDRHKGGLSEMAFLSVGGAYTNSASKSSIYLDKEHDFFYEYGFEPETVNVTISGATKNLVEWLKELQRILALSVPQKDAYVYKNFTEPGQGYLEYVADITAAIETALMNQSSKIALYNDYAASIYSWKVSTYTTVYNQFVGFGGIKMLKFNYNDAGWAAYKASHPGNLF